MKDKNPRHELRHTEWFKRWRTGDFRHLLTELKRDKEPARRHPKCAGRFDFRCANLRRAKLESVALADCCLNEAELYSAHLENGDLSNCELIDADLGNANLRNARLTGSNLTNCNLNGADLAFAVMDHAILTGATLAGANLHQVSIEAAQFDLGNISHVKGLSTVTGVPASTSGTKIDSRTLEKADQTPLKAMLVKSAEVTRKKFDYDVAISFAGEDRKVADDLARAMTSIGLRVFYDDFEKAQLWGKNLYDHLTTVYRELARFCVIVVSNNYARKQWPNHERQAAQSRAFQENREYILPLRVDDIEVVGILPTTAYLKLADNSIVEIARLVKEKVKVAKKNQLTSGFSGR